MPNVVVIAGPNGAGKSTAAPTLLRELLGIGEFVNADVIARGLSAYNPEGAAIEWVANPQLSIARVAKRVQAGGHHVEDDVVRRRYWGGLRNFFELYRPLAETWRVFDNSEHPHGRLVAAGSHDQTRVVYDEGVWNMVLKGSQA